MPSYYVVCIGSTLTLSLLDVFGLSSINTASIEAIAPPGIATATIDSNTWNISITGIGIGHTSINMKIATDTGTVEKILNVIVDDCSQIIITPSGPQCPGVATTIEMPGFQTTTIIASITDVSIADPTIATIVSVDKTNLIIVVKGSSTGSTTIDITFNFHNVTSNTDSTGYFSIPFIVKDCMTGLSLVEFFLSLNQPFSRRC